MREMPIKELLSHQLPGLPGTKPGLIGRAKRDGWKVTERRGDSGQMEMYVVLPGEIQSSLIQKELTGNLPVVEERKKVVQTAHLADWQRKILDGRAAILSELDRLVTHQGFSQNKAIDTLIKLAKNNELPEHLMQHIEAANARNGKNGKRTLSRASLFNWKKAREENNLAPKTPTQREIIPVWVAAFMDLWATPQKRSVAACLDQLAVEGHPFEIPHYDAVRRFLNKLSPQTLNHGRMGPREIKSIKAYVKRTVDELWPTAVYVADGHTFDAEVQHPMHGRPFRPEITTIIDVYTRRAVGWSVGLSESTLSVLDAARNAFEKSGLCDIWYVDNGSGFNNEKWDDQLTGFLPRLSISKHNSLPYNSQARGVIERLHQTIWVRGAKNLPTYVGADMDREARQQSFKITRKDIKSPVTSGLLPRWSDFVLWCEEQVEDYNNRPHKTLPKIRDPHTGRIRHMSPNEVWANEVSQGWKSDTLDAQESEDLYRPYERRKTTRALVRLFGNEYYHPALEAHHDSYVLVGYDIHNAEVVWVKDLQERLICVAKWGGHEKSFFPVSAAQDAHEKRVRGRLKRNEAKREEIEQEGNPLAIEHQPAEPVIPVDLSAGKEALEALLNKAENTTRNERPLFNNDIDFVRYIMASPEAVTDTDKALLRRLIGSSTFVMQLEMTGIDVASVRQLISQSAVA
ncbi:Mu transposase C-terminal domain-containing protein [Kiloniella litopenaei]|uniref:Mu transposase C-terminal domain-containing protein n=1 Tax=Kiloniella litopenaei TaxID=1549748 RepID=UPI003BAD9BA6